MKSSSHSKAIQLPTNGANYQPLLKGAPDSCSMKSGYVSLKPGESVGLHSTEDKEELVIPLSGAGELRCPDCEPLAIKPGWVFYNPPHTPHDVVNTGCEPLCYIYIVARTS